MNEAGEEGIQNTINAYKMTELDKKLTEALKKSRGKRFFRIKNILQWRIGPYIAGSAEHIKSRTGKFTPRDVAAIAIEFNLPYKTTCEILEYYHSIPTGTYENLHDRGIKVGVVMDAAKEAILEGLY